ncbi:MAG: diacylglycerol/lipid kinase family protein [Rhodoluna sp.]
MKRLGVIVNPGSGNGAGKLIGEIAITELQREAEVLNLSGNDLASSLENAKQALDDCLLDGLVVVGGDGMVHHAINLVAQTDIPFGIVAAGTGNDSARTLGLPIHDGIASARVILSNLNQPRVVDAVSATTSTGQFWFFGTLSAGFEALVNQRANTMKWPKGPARYQVAMVAELAKFKPIQYKAEIDGEVREFEAMLCAVCNSPQFGGGMKVVPFADVTDGFIELFIVHKMSRFELIKVFPKVYSGGHVDHPAVEIIRAKKVKIDAGKMPAYSDGEAVGFSPISTEVVQGALKVFATSARNQSMA